MRRAKQKRNVRRRLFGKYQPANRENCKNFYVTRVLLKTRGDDDTLKRRNNKINKGISKLCGW